MKTITKIFILCAGFFTLSSPCLADSANPWSTTSHLGFALIDSSSTGFEDVSGSMIFIDVDRKIGPSIAIGMRTVGQGGQLPDREFYRLSAGPHASWSTQGWRIHGSMGLFRESAKSNGLDAYRSKGLSGVLGFQRTKTILGRAMLAWGPFVTWHQGQLQHEPSTNLGFLAGVTKNKGTSHGVSMAITLPL